MKVVKTKQEDEDCVTPTDIYTGGKKHIYRRAELVYPNLQIGITKELFIHTGLIRNTSYYTSDDIQIDLALSNTEEALTCKVSDSFELLKHLLP